MAKVQNGEEILAESLNHLSRAHERYKQQMMTEEDL